MEIDGWGVKFRAPLWSGFGLYGTESKKGKSGEIMAPLDATHPGLDPSQPLSFPNSEPGVARCGPIIRPTYL